MVNVKNIVPVILCGGEGKRLWPLSRKSYPKQFSKIISEDTMFQLAASICSGSEFEAPLIVTAENFRFVVDEQLEEINRKPSGILVEPYPKNTAASVLAGALSLHASNQDYLMLVMPSDHMIPDTKAFQDCVIAAAPTAMEGRMVTFGIKPTRAETGYGYLELAEKANSNENAPQPLEKFIEKPDYPSALRMYESDRYLWNAGVFLFKPERIIDAFRMYAPEILAKVEGAFQTSQKDLNFIRLGAEEWSKLDNISIDYAIMENEKNLYVMPYSSSWSDLGSWEAVHTELEKDSSGNALSQNATAIECKDTLLRSETPSLELVGIGLEDIIAVAMPDAVLVAKKSDSQNVKEAVNRLQIKGVNQATDFNHDHRPWGYFESIVRGDRFQVKRIVVNPGAALSLQSHFHRSEHWIVVHGTAKVTIDETVQLLTENQSIYIPLGAVHRLENPGKMPTTLIEVQTGSYLGEDDIIRYEDVYKRG